MLFTASNLGSLLYSINRSKRILFYKPFPLCFPSSGLHELRKSLLETWIKDLIFTPFPPRNGARTQTHSVSTDSSKRLRKGSSDIKNTMLPAQD